MSGHTRWERVRNNALDSFTSAGSSQEIYEELINQMSKQDLLLKIMEIKERLAQSNVYLDDETNEGSAEYPVEYGRCLGLQEAIDILERKNDQ